MAQVIHRVDIQTIWARLGTTPGGIATFCASHGICWLALFGSALRDDFREHSDLDLLVAWLPGREPPSTGALLTLTDALSRLCGGREPDLIAFDRVRWRIRPRVYATAITIYSYGAPPAEVVRTALRDSPGEDEPVKNEYLYIGDMLDAAREAAGLAAGKTRRDYDTNRMLQLAVLHLIQTIGEAATHVSRETRAQYPAIPWGEIIGMRYVLVHGYATIDPDKVWDTVTNGLPPLIAILEAMLPPELHAEPPRG